MCRLQGRFRLGYSLEVRQAPPTSTTRLWAVRKSAPRMGWIGLLLLCLSVSAGLGTSLRTEEEALQHLEGLLGGLQGETRTRRDTDRGVT